MVTRVCFTASDLVKVFTLNNRSKIFINNRKKYIPAQHKNIRILSSLVYNLYEFGQKYIY